MKKKKRKIPALDKYVIFSLAVLIIFTIVSFVYQFITQQEISGTLTTCFFAAFGGELLSLAMIKRLKLKDTRKKEDEEDEEYGEIDE